MIDHLEHRRARVATAWNLGHEIVLVGAGWPLGIPGGADQTFPFVAHSDYFYLADREVAGGVVAFDPQEGWVDFVPEPTSAERLWEGKQPLAGTPLAELHGWLAARRRRPTAVLGCAIAGVPGEDALALELGQELFHARRTKDAVELERMRAAAAAIAPAFAAAERMARTGVTGRQIQIELEAECFRHGADRMAFDTIVATGPEAAVLHSAPTSRVVGPGDVVLIDAGASVRRYASDVTRTYRAPGGDGAFFRDLYALVLAVEQRGLSRCIAGHEWREAHLEAAVGIVEGLIALGLMRGNAQAMVESGAHTVFFPHGLGHLVGLGVRDASGRAPGRLPNREPALANLRCDLPLQAGYAITVEPGIYFIPARFGDPEIRSRHRDAIVWDRVERWVDFGGIRIEDDVVVTSGDPEVLTAAIPKRAE